jgi:hypothetical protein
MYHICLRNVLENNLRSAITLTDSNRHQAIVCALITDVNFDSKNEILLGTYGNVIDIKHKLKNLILKLYIIKLCNTFCFSIF